MYLFIIVPEFFIRPFSAHSDSHSIASFNGISKNHSPPPWEIYRSLQSHPPQLAECIRRSLQIPPLNLNKSPPFIFSRMCP